MGRPVTLRHLADHTSGVRDQWELLIMEGCEDLGRWIAEMEKLFHVDRKRFGRFGWGLNSLEFSLGEDGMADGFRTTGGRVRNLRFLRLMPSLTPPGLSDMLPLAVGWGRWNDFMRTQLEGKVMR